MQILLVLGMCDGILNTNSDSDSLCNPNSDVPNELMEQVPELRASFTSNATEIGLAILGNVDAGKSSLTACLSERILDNGDGSARSRVFVHDHEKTTGRTSDISSKVIEYTEKHLDAFLEGKYVVENDKKVKNKQHNNGENEEKMKIISLHDLCGHEKYFKTTTHGVSSMYPDYAILVVNPSRGVLQMTKEHYTILVSLNIPVLIVITKVDTSTNFKAINETENQIKELLKKYRRTCNFINSFDEFLKYDTGEKKFLELRDKQEHTHNTKYNDIEKNTKNHIKIQTMRNEQDSFLMDLKKSEDLGCEYLNEYVFYNKKRMEYIKTIISNLNTSNEGKQGIVPVICMSNCTGWHLDTIRDSIMFLKSRKIWDVEHNSIIKTLGNKIGNNNLGKVKLTGSIFYIDHPYFVEGTGLVVTGINSQEKICTNDKLFIGPIGKRFMEVKVKSIHNNARQTVDSLDDHHRGCLNITAFGKEKITKKDIKKGMVLLSDYEMTKYVAYHFNAVITVLKNETKNTTLRVGACPMMDAGTIKQTVRFKDILGCEKKGTSEIIKPGEVKEVQLKFVKKPEFIPEGRQFIFRSGTVHGIGVVIQPLEISQDVDAQPDPNKKKIRKMRYHDRSGLKINVVDL